MLGIFNYCLFSVVRLSMTVLCKEYRYMPTRAELGNTIRVQRARGLDKTGHSRSYLFGDMCRSISLF